MAELIDRVKAVSEKLGLRINETKTNVMVVDRAESLPNSSALGEYEKINTFVYSDSTIESNGGSSAPNRTKKGKNDRTAERHMQ